MKALAGEIPHFTGVSDPYEAPEHPDLHLRTDQISVEEGVGQLLALLGLDADPNPEASRA